MPEEKQPEGSPPAPPPEPKLPTFASQVKKEWATQHAQELSAYAGKEIQDVLDEHFKLKKTVAERGIIVPTKDSPKEEVDAFLVRMDLPGGQDGYELKAEHLPAEAVTELRAFAHANGLNRKQAQAVVARLDSIALAGKNATATRKAEAERTFMQNLTAAMGGDEKAAGEARNLAMKAIQGSYSQATIQRMIDLGLVYDAGFLKETAAAQARIEPHRLVTGDAGDPKGPTKPPAQGRQGNYSDAWNNLYGRKGA